MSANTGIRDFDLERDLPFIKRIWKEIGWTTEEHEIAQLDFFYSCGATAVGTIDDVPECAVHTVPGSMRMLSTDLPLCAVTAVTTSRIARGQSFAQRLTALQLAQGARDGAAVAALGMFDQGFYDKVGFGTGAYMHRFSIDPASLKVNHRVRSPQRLSIEDYTEIHNAMRNRSKVHGSVVLDPPILVKAELGFEPSGFGLGYKESGELTHFMWLEPQDAEHGPYDVRWIGYQSFDQLIELLGLIKSLGDQVYSVNIPEPAGIQLQSLIDRPFRQKYVTRNSKLAVQHRAIAWWQFRMMDVPACIAALSTELPVAMNVHLHDPVEKLLSDERSEWKGVGGEYVVNMGQTSTAHQGQDASLPTLECDVGSFTRLVWGVVPASGLAVTDTFSAPAHLLDQLDRALRLPTPDVGWDF